MNAPVGPNPVIFFHIPKTAGSTLHSILERQYPGRYFTLRSLREEHKFTDLTQEERDNIRMLKGHMRFGVHVNFSRPATYFTLLRDPVERVVSNYYSLYNKPQFDVYHRLKAHNINSLLDLVQSDQFLTVDNLQTRYIAGGMDIPFGACDEALLEKAKANLDSYFTLAGTVDHFDEALLMLRKIYHWHIPVYTRKNQTQGKPKRSEMDEQALVILRKINVWDEKLYQYVRERFIRRIESEGPGFQKELKRFRQINSIFQVVAGFRNKYLLGSGKK